ncbi:hypothetical protein CK623_06400 [Vandammella animalimorsus]|uniref:Uncharacterized protein n=1 Tax=Vandammella animalimorsus TaxID=2029117 RepID=A0A2A2ARH5_9BURK|nr:hypothetical protein CK623_06400 [Vandammella animalimorsus]
MRTICQPWPGLATPQAGAAGSGLGLQSIHKPLPPGHGRRSPEVQRQPGQPYQKWKNLWQIVFN